MTAVCLPDKECTVYVKPMHADTELANTEISIPFQKKEEKKLSAVDLAEDYHAEGCC